MNMEQCEEQREWCRASHDQCNGVEREKVLVEEGSVIGLDKKDKETQPRIAFLHKQDFIK